MQFDTGALVENVNFIPALIKSILKMDPLLKIQGFLILLNFISNAQEPSIGGFPKNIFFLTCDAFGVLPPISKLTPGQAMYQFISGYTAKVAGTEAGVTEPKPTFSACFGALFFHCIPENMQRCLEKNEGE